MGVVETPHKGMEHQTVNAYGNNYAKTAYGYDELLQHEFAHEWFGNQLTNTNWDDMWLHGASAPTCSRCTCNTCTGTRNILRR
jgi:aminopeptidase N